MADPEDQQAQDRRVPEENGESSQESKAPSAEDRREFFKRLANTSAAFLVFPGFVTDNTSPEVNVDKIKSGLKYPAANHGSAVPGDCPEGFQYSDGANCGDELGSSFSCESFNCEGGVWDDFECVTAFTCNPVFFCTYSFDAEDCQGTFACPGIYWVEP